MPPHTEPLQCSDASTDTSTETSPPPDGSQAHNTTGTARTSPAAVVPGHVVAYQLLHGRLLRPMAGRLGTETLSIQLGGSGTSLMVIIDQMTSSDLPAKAPLIQVWHYPSSKSPREITLDLEQIASPQVSRDGLTMRRHRLALDLPDTQAVEPDDAVLAVSITGQDAPMRTVFYQDHSQLTPGLHTRMSVYRTIVMVEVARDDDASTPHVRMCDTSDIEQTVINIT